MLWLFPHEDCGMKLCIGCSLLLGGLLWLSPIRFSWQHPGLILVEYCRFISITVLAVHWYFWIGEIFCEVWISELLPGTHLSYIFWGVWSHLSCHLLIFMQMFVLSEEGQQSKGKCEGQCNHSSRVWHTAPKTTGWIYGAIGRVVCILWIAK